MRNITKMMFLKSNLVPTSGFQGKIVHFTDITEITEKYQFFHCHAIPFGQNNWKFTDFTEITGNIKFSTKYLIFPL